MTHQDFELQEKLLAMPWHIRQLVFHTFSQKPSFTYFELIQLRRGFRLWKC